MNASKTFTQVVKGRNMFTPRVLSYFKIPNGAIELSTVKSNQPKGLTSSRFMEDVYGVTVVVDNELDLDKSNIFNTYKEATSYIKTFNPTSEQYYERVNSYGDTVLKTLKINPTT